MIKENIDFRCESCIVRQLNTFKALSKKELQNISDNKIRQTFKKGKTIFDEDEKLNGIYCVRSGVAKLSRMSENGKDQILKLATRGVLLGQRSVLVDNHTHLSAKAVKDLEVCFIPKHHITDSLNANPLFTKAVLVQMTNDLNFADEMLVGMAQKSVKQRLALVILYLDKKFNLDKEGYIDMVLTREEIASVVGSTKEACIRALAVFRKKGVIISDGKRIKIEDINGLKKMV